MLRQSPVLRWLAGRVHAVLLGDIRALILLVFLTIAAVGIPLVALLASAGSAHAATSLYAYDSWLDDTASGVDFKTGGTVKCSLHTSSYTPNRGTHNRFDDITAEVANGNGYTTGGQAATLTYSLNTTAHTLTVTLPQLTWPSSTFTVRYMVCRKARGGAASADELVLYVDLGADVSPTAGTLTVNGGTMTINSPAP